MRRLTTLLLMATTFTAFAQPTIDVQQQPYAMSLGERTGFTVVIPRADEKDCVKAYREWIDEQAKKPDIKESGKHELRAEQVTLKLLGDTPANIYFLFTQGKDGVMVTGFFDIGGTFVSDATQPANAQACTRFMQRYAVRMQKLEIAAQLAAEKKIQEKQTEDKEELLKKEKQLEEKIADCEETIKQAKSDLSENADAQKSKGIQLTKESDSYKISSGETKDKSSSVTTSGTTDSITTKIGKPDIEKQIQDIVYQPASNQAKNMGESNQTKKILQEQINRMKKIMYR